jgi:hypothetical protein
MQAYDGTCTGDSCAQSFDVRPKHEKRLEFGVYVGLYAVPGRRTTHVATSTSPPTGSTRVDGVRTTVIIQIRQIVVCCRTNLKWKLLCICFVPRVLQSCLIASRDRRQVF